MLVHPQFWGEDSNVLFLQARMDGWRTLFRPYPAYFIFAQRLVACLAANLPVLWNPACFCYGGLGLMLLTAWYCLRARLDYLMDFRGRIALALALPLTPQSGEIWIVLIGSQWTLAAVLMILVLQDQTRRLGEAAIDLLGLLLAGLTGPFIVLFAPWFLLRFRRVTGGFSPYNIVFVAAAWSLVLGQILMMRTGPLPPGHYSPDPQEWIKELGYWLPGGLFFGESVPDYIINLFWIISPALLASLVWALWQTERKRFWAALALCGAGAAVYLGGISTTSPTMAEDLVPFGGGGRYFYLVYLFAIWMGIIFYFDSFRPLHITARIALAMIALASASRFTFPPQENLHWEVYARKVDAGESLPAVPVLPDWTIPVPAR